MRCLAVSLADTIIFLLFFIMPLPPLDNLVPIARYPVGLLDLEAPFAFVY